MNGIRFCSSRHISFLVNQSVLSGGRHFGWVTAKVFALEAHFDGAEMDKQRATKLGLSWSNGLQSSCFYSQPVTEKLWNQHHDFLIPETATEIRN